MNPDPVAVAAWSDRVAAYFTTHGGLPPITARTLAFLLVCDPPERSAADIAEAVGASRASLSSTLHQLRDAELVHVVGRPRTRTAYYRVAEEGWALALQRRFAGVAALVGVTREGLELFGPDSPQAERIRAAHEVYAWFADEVEPLWRRWNARGGA